MDKKIFDEALRMEGATGDFEKLARSIFAQESGSGKNTTTSNAGAVGGMQIIPPTFKSVADKGWDINNPMDNARAGIRYLAQMHKVSGGDPALTAAGYYGGPGAIAKAKQGIAVSDPRNPNAPTTLQYGQQVAARAGLIPAINMKAQMNTSVAPPTSTSSTVVQNKTMPPMPMNDMAQVMDTVPSESTTYRDQVAAQDVPPIPMTEQDAWAAFQKTLPQQETMVQAQAQQPQPQFNYGGSEGVVIPNFAATVSRMTPSTNPNFSAFKSWGRQRG